MTTHPPQLSYSSHEEHYCLLIDPYTKTITTKTVRQGIRPAAEIIGAETVEFYTPEPYTVITLIIDQEGGLYPDKPMFFIKEPTGLRHTYMHIYGKALVTRQWTDLRTGERTWEHLHPEDIRWVLNNTFFASSPEAA